MHNFGQQALNQWFDFDLFQQYFSPLKQMNGGSPYSFAFDGVEDCAWTIVEETDSTNCLLAEQCRSQPCGYSAIVIAQTQTAGRGQWGRSWTSEKGGLYLSWGFQTVISNDRLSLIPLAAAWGVAIGLQSWGIPVQLKWPNDLILAGRKLGGILVETKSLAGISPPIVLDGAEKPTTIGIGIGVNWNNHPPEPGIALSAYQQSQTADLTEKPGIQNLEHLTAIVLTGLIQGCKEWLNPARALADSITQYEALLSNRGQWIPIQGEMGQIVGITPTGSLRIQLPTQEICCAPGSLNLGYG